MSRKDFEVISVLGPLGAGKTTTLNRLIENVPVDDSYAVVVNDVGENNIDAQRIWDHPANRSERIIPLTAGCIGCSDVTQFREALEQVHDAGINVLFIEPTGIAPGTEIAEVVQSSGFDLSILTLANAQTVERDLRWQVLPSQLAVADIVGITHIPKEKDEAEVMSLVLEQLPPLPDDVSVELVKPGVANYFEILTKLRGMEKQLSLGRRAVTSAHDHAHHHHGHDHEHHHEGHGVSAKSFRLKQNVTIEQIAELLRPLVHNDENPLLRAKGTVEGLHFDLVGDEWNTESDTLSNHPVMNVIFGGQLPANFLAQTGELVESVERIQVSGDKKTIVKSVSEMPISDRVAIVEERVTQYPHPISALHGELIPDCEADEGYEIAFWGNRDDMPDDSKKIAMDAYIRFRLSGLHHLCEHSESITNYNEKKAYWFRRYGATLGYNGYYLAEYIDPALLSEIREHNPAQMLADGLMELEQLTFDEGRAEEKPEFVLSVLQPALERGDVTTETVKKLAAHITALTKANQAYAARWQKTFDNLLAS